MDIDAALLGAIESGIREGIKSKLSGYGSPLDKTLNDVLAGHDAEFRSLLNGAIESAIGDQDFREKIRGEVLHKLSQVLVQRFGGELEKQVNVLKSDPSTRARITLAIEEIVKSKANSTA